MHVGIIMDGNGRWARQRGLPRVAGHRAGAEQLRAIIAAAPGAGIGTLTLYAFSADNWQRPVAEVEALMHLFAESLERAADECRAHDVAVAVIGRRDRLPLRLRGAIALAERATRRARGLHLRIALDYSARDQILRAARRAEGAAGLTRERFPALLAQAMHDRRPVTDVDLLIRTGGERRLSDFLLWECAYAELYFSDRGWPDFGPSELRAAVADFRGRDRRFGRIPAQEGA